MSFAGKGKTHKLSGSTESIVDGVQTPDPNGKVSMKVKTNNKNKPKKIKEVEYENLDGTCQGPDGYGGTATYGSEESGQLAGVPVNKRSGEFSKTFNFVGLAMTLEGKVTKKGKKATGTLEVLEEAGVSQVSCTTEASFEVEK